MLVHVGLYAHEGQRTVSDVVPQAMCLLFLRWYLLLAWKWPSRLDPQTCDPQGPAGLHLPRAGATSNLYACFIFSSMVSFCYVGFSGL